MYPYAVLVVNVVMCSFQELKGELLCLRLMMLQKLELLVEGRQWMPLT